MKGGGGGGDNTEIERQKVRIGPKSRRTTVRTG